VNQKLLKYYVAFEKGTISDDDAAPRIRELRAEQIKVERAKGEALHELATMFRVSLSSVGTSGVWAPCAPSRRGGTRRSSRQRGAGGPRRSWRGSSA